MAIISSLICSVRIIEHPWLVLHLSKPYSASPICQYDHLFRLDSRSLNEVAFADLASCHGTRHCMCAARIIGGAMPWPARPLALACACPVVFMADNESSSETTSAYENPEPPVPWLSLVVSSCQHSSPLSLIGDDFLLYTRVYVYCRGIIIGLLAIGALLFLARQRRVGSYGDHYRA